VTTTAPVQRKAPRPRADALRNRERIVTAAREMFVEFGPYVPLDEVARRAGVGNATVYRNFPDRDALVREVVCQVMDRTAQAARQALEETGDAFEALERFVHVSADERVAALCPMISSTFDVNHPDLEASRVRVEQLIEQLMERARLAGQLREDVGPGDLMVVVAQLSRPPAGTGCLSADRFVHRHLQVFLDGLRAPAPSALPGTPVTLEDLRQA
jgi:AcrR family transcriptional regulator